MTTVNVDIPTHLSLTEMSNLCELGVNILSSRAQSEAWEFDMHTGNEASEPNGIDTKQFVIDKLPKEIQLSVKQAYLKQHSPCLFKRVSELAAEQLHRLLAQEKLFRSLAIHLDTVQVSIHCVGDKTAYARLFAEVKRFMQQHNVFLLSNHFGLARVSTAQFLQRYREYLAEGITGLLKYHVDSPELSTRRLANHVKRRLLRLYLFNTRISTEDAVNYFQDALGQNDFIAPDIIADTLATWNKKHQVSDYSRQHVWEIAVYPDTVNTGQVLITLLNGAMSTQVSAVSATASSEVCAGLIRQALLMWPAPEILYFDNQRLPLGKKLIQQLAILGINTTHSPFEADLFAHRWPLADITAESTYIFEEFSQHPWLLNHYWQTFSSVDLVNADFARLFDVLLPEAGENQGFTTVESDGVYLNGERFFMVNLGIYEGYSVFCRQDPVHSSRALMFSSISRQYLGELYRG